MRRTKFCKSILIVVALAVAATPGIAAAEPYNLIVSSTGGGNVTAPGEGAYSYNTSQAVRLTAVPDDYYHFVRWTGNVGTIESVGSSMTNIAVNGNYSICANFAINQYVLGITGSSGGNVTEGICTYDYGMVVGLVAKPDEGYRFVNWTGYVDTIADVNAATTNITMPAQDVIVIANFELIPTYKLAIVANPKIGGVVTDLIDSYTAGTVVSIQARASVGYIFDCWTIAPEVAFVNIDDTRVSFAMPSNDVVVIANFKVQVPATFVYSGLTISPDVVTVGQNVTVSVRVDNTGDLAGSCVTTLNFMETPSTFVHAPQTQTATLDAGSHIKLVFVVSPTVVGVYRIDIGGLGGTFEVAAKPSGFPWWACALVIIVAVAGVYAIIAHDRKKAEASETPKLSFKDSLKLRFLVLIQRLVNRSKRRRTDENQ